MVDWLNQKFPVSINNRLFNKNEYGDKSAFSDGFKNTELTPGELKASIEKGFAYSSVYCGKRKAINFLETGFLSLDFDTPSSEEKPDGYSIEAIQTSELFRKSATLLYTTHSHDRAKPKFRIVFALERPINDATELSAILRSLALRFGSDSSATDPARLFYGNSKTAVTIRPNGLTSEEIRELIDQSKNLDFLETEITKSRTTRQSELSIKVDLYVKTAQGSEQLFSDLAKDTPIHCPYHNDKNPSAFIFESEEGIKGIHCCSCGLSYWPERQTYDFTTFDTAIERRLELNDISLGGSERTTDSPPTIVETLAPSSDSASQFLNNRVESINSKYLEKLSITEGLNFIKSPKGTGKTEFVSKLVADQTKRVLLVGHRRSLIKHLCERFKLDCYLDPDPSKRRMGICLDSIHTLGRADSYDYVIVDESEQVLAHFLSDTMEDRRQKSFKFLSEIVKRAKTVIALDADLGWTSYRFFCRCGRKEGLSNVKSIFVNQYVCTRPKISSYDSYNHLVSDISIAIAKDEKCYITSNSKRDVEKLHIGLEKDFPEKKFMIVTSATSSTKCVKSFLLNVKTECQNYDAVLSSPSISTGIDISFEDNEQVFDHVFGLFHAGFTTHFECDQQMARVRHPKNVSVFISPAEQNLETDLGVVGDNLERGEFADSVLDGFDEDGEPTNYEQSDLLRLGCDVVSTKRASINQLKKNFVRHMERQGFEIERISADGVEAAIGKAFIARSKELLLKEKTEHLLTFPRLTESKMIEIADKFNKDKSLTISELFSVQRTYIELFYRQSISADLIKLDDDGKLRPKIRLLEDLIYGSRTQMRELEKEFLDPSSLQAKVFRDPEYKFHFLDWAFESAKIWNGEQFDTNIELDSDDLSEFVEYLTKNKDKYHSIFNMELRKDFYKKPIAKLNSLLKHVGLNMHKVRTRSEKGLKRYKYGFGETTFPSSFAIVSTRKSSPGTIEYLNDKYPTN